MFLSEKTIKNYVTHLLVKLKVHSRTEAAILATKVTSAGPRRRPSGLMQWRARETRSIRPSIPVRNVVDLVRKREVSRESSDILRGTEVEQGAVVGHFDG